MEEIILTLKPYLNVLLIGLVGFFLAYISSQILNRIFSRFMGEGWSRLIGGVAALAIVVWTIKLILDTAGAAGLIVVFVTILTAAFAIGSERIASDVVSGVSLFFARPYHIGDIISIAGQEGRVRSIAIMQTTLESVFGDQIYIRNSDVASGTIVNYSATPGHPVSAHLVLPASTDLNRVVDLIQKAIKDFSPEISGSAYQPSVSVESGEMGTFSLDIRAYVSDRLDYTPEKTRLFLLVINTLKNAGIPLS
jgi:small conductance mechanosensitive channel